MKQLAIIGIFLLPACGPDGTFDLLPRDGGSDSDAACGDLLADPTNCGACGRGCAHNQYCHQGQCECLPGLTLCGTSCFDLSSDPDHCGGCSAAPCGSGLRCEMSGCHSGTCSMGLLACPVGDRTQCAKPTLPFCNACGVVCAPDQVCTSTGCKKYAPGCSACAGTCCTWLTGSICVEGSSCP